MRVPILLRVLLLSSDVPANPTQTTSNSDLAYQDLCMHNFLCKQWRTPACDVPGARCIDNVVDTIIVPNTCTKDFAYVPVRLDIQWLPESLTKLTMRMKVAVSELQTRLLPRGLTVFRANTCMLKGSLDVPNLPRGIVTFDVAVNKLTGFVVLHEVPETLRELRVERNAISTVFGGGALPDDLIIMYFSSASGSVDFVSLTGKSKDRRILLSKSEYGRRNRKGLYGM